MSETAGNKRGRPTAYRPEYCDDLLEHMKIGGSFEGFPGYLVKKYKDMSRAVNKQTLYNWTQAHPDFLDAKERGELLAWHYLDELGFQGMTGQLKRLAKRTVVLTSDGKPVIGPDGKIVYNEEYAQATFGQAAWIFTRKNRNGWRDRLETVDPSNEPKSLSELVARVLSEPDPTPAAAGAKKTPG